VLQTGRVAQTRNVATRPAKARDEAGADQIDPHAHADDRDRRGRSLRRARRCGGSDHHDVHTEPDEFGGEDGIGLDLAVGITILDDDVPALDVAEVSEALAETADVRFIRGIGFCRDQNANPRNSARLLCLRRDRGDEEH
jgi:hypothetical protein